MLALAAWSGVAASHRAGAASSAAGPAGARPAAAASTLAPVPAGPFWPRRSRALGPATVAPPVPLNGRRSYNAPCVCRAGVGPGGGKSSSPKEELLAGVDKDNREAVARVLDQASAAASRWSTELTDFLSPPERVDAERALGRLGEVEARAFGGYPSAERVRLCVGRPEVLAGAEEADAIALLTIEGNFMFDEATHRDFLGAICGSGVVREKVGDILLQTDRGAQALVVPEMAEYFTTALTQVRSIKVITSVRPLADLRFAAPKAEAVTSFEASLRLDAVASAGFRTPRSAMVELIESREVRVNWKDAIKPAMELKTGDIVSIRGKGRLEIGEISLSKKERYVVNMIRYV